MDETGPIYEKIIFQNEEKGLQLRAVVSEFREVEYFHLRRYYLSYEGEYVPTKEGISMPMSIQNVYSLLDALVEICAKAEGVESMTKHFEQKISDLNSKG